ncbi:MAG: hypothetical protein ILNGONEN_01407 [Syntrophorhabdaceae bacterium]|nr:hypothetical protein [Syntrophorhabdaceae bacterium]
MQWDVFICHASEDKKDFVTPLALALKQLGLKVWYDNFTLRLGDSLRQSIDRGLADSKFGIVVLSHAFFEKDWPQYELDGLVEKEGSGIKVILPIWHGVTKQEVRRYSLSLSNRKAVSTSDGLEKVVSAIIEAVSHELSIPKEPKATQTLQTMQLRSRPVYNLSDDDLKKMLTEKDFFHWFWNRTGKGIRHNYNATERTRVKLVIDSITGLTWQQSGSDDKMRYEDALDYIDKLKRDNFGGYNDWRLPTLAETMSLMEAKMHGDLYIDPVFDSKQKFIWTADQESAGKAWYVLFQLGYCYNDDINSFNFVRAVR